MRNKVFIIGNGFDLDLGMNTRFSDFAKSEDWPFKTSTLDLAYYLRKRAKIEKWFDLETELLNYARAGGLNHANTDKHSFDELVVNLTKFISTEEKKQLITDSVAAQVLKAIINNGYFESIYSFNYTNLHEIARNIGVYKEFKYEHVHGSLKDNTIILGFEEETDVKPGYEYMYKTFSPHYESHPIQYDLQEADEVVFFGHSLGHNDYHYFKVFFQSQCIPDMTREKGKRITIFTYDDKSRIEILKQLRQMNEKRTNLLFNLNTMQIICTKDGGGKRMVAFLERMNEESAELDAQRLGYFASNLP